MLRWLCVIAVMTVLIACTPTSSTPSELPRPDRGTPTTEEPTVDPSRDWLTQKIEQWTRKPDANTPDAVYRYQYRGQTVYYVRAACCDRFNVVYDIQGRELCSPDGGFTGRGDGECPSFREEARDGVTVWEAKRP